MWTITFRVPQGSVLDPLLFLIYIKDLNLVIEHCKVYHFTDDTNLLNVSWSPRELNKLINSDLRNLTYWLKANEILFSGLKKA